MNIDFKKTEKVVRITTVATLSVLICWGLLSVIFQIKPFWVDEWRVIYNLKFKDAESLWGPLDFMQQFPRVYLELIKAFTSAFNYSYTTLRLPSFLVGTATVLLCYRLMKKLYPDGHLNRFLFVMILVSYCTFTDYYVQIKQYSMDMFLSLIGIWQLIELISLRGTKTLHSGKYVLLCLSFLIVPFFSYTYPIVVAPVFGIILLQSLGFLAKENNGSNKRVLALQWFPLCLSACSILVFYFIDVAQLMKDQGMRSFWGHLMMAQGFADFFDKVYNLFAVVGAGLLYWYIFGILGTAAFLFGIYKTGTTFFKREPALSDISRLYAVLLLLMVIVLFIAGKLPLAEPRLNAFTIPSISILIIYFLDQMQEYKNGKFSYSMTAILYIGVIGNIYTTIIASITGNEYEKKMNIYRSTENAIVLAQVKNLPILVTPEVAYPYDKTVNLPYEGTVPGDWVLKTFPAYSVMKNTPVYAIKDMANLKEDMKGLPANVKKVLAGDGKTFLIIRRD